MVGRFCGRDWCARSQLHSTNDNYFDHVEDAARALIARPFLSDRNRSKLCSSARNNALCNVPECVFAFNFSRMESDELYD